MTVVLAILKFVVVFIAVASSLLFATSVIKSIVNPQILISEDGQAYDGTRNTRVWLGIIMCVFWALFSLF